MIYDPLADGKMDSVVDNEDLVNVTKLWFTMIFVAVQYKGETWLVLRPMHNNPLCTESLRIQRDVSLKFQFWL